MSNLVIVPAAILRSPAKPVTAVDSRVLQVLINMKDTLLRAKDPQGVGLAAPQIGELLRIFMIRPDPKGPITTFINPEITHYSQRTTQPTGKHAVYEGCLSLPHHYAPVQRSESVTVKYQSIKSKIQNSNNQINTKYQIKNSKHLGFDDLDFIWNLEFSALDLEEKTSVFSGFPAHIIQHEMDHLNGILFIDRVLEQNAKLYKVEGKEWAEVSL